MNQADFFATLEGRLCDYLRGAGSPVWCDGFVPNSAFDTTQASFVAGEVWMMAVPPNASEELWSFNLRVNQRLDASDDWADLEALFGVDFEARMVLVYCGRAGTDLTPTNSDPRRDLVDYLVHRGIHAELVESKYGASILAKRDPSDENSDAQRVMQQGSSWVVEELTGKFGGVVFGTWKAACDHVIACWAEA